MWSKIWKGGEKEVVSERVRSLVSEKRLRRVSKEGRRGA